MGRGSLNIFPQTINYVQRNFVTKRIIFHFKYFIDRQI